MKSKIVLIVPNDNEKEREDRYGRVRVSHTRTWLVVVEGEVEGEFSTLRAAKERLAVLNKSSAMHRGVKM